jgi:hypothetical protein
MSSDTWIVPMPCHRVLGAGAVGLTGVMAADEYGPWAPLPLDEAVGLFAGAGFRWWISGGHAFELHLGRSWRDHDDTDVSLRRDDAPAMREHLSRWDLHIGAAGVLTPWDGHPLDEASHENNVWARRTPSSPWALDLTISGGDDREWVYRRDPAVRRPWHEAVLRSSGGVPYLAPEIELLFKCKNTRAKDDVDAAEVIPALEPDRRAWLFRHLPPGHRWVT